MDCVVAPVDQASDVPPAGAVSVIPPTEVQKSADWVMLAVAGSVTVLLAVPGQLFDMDTVTLYVPE
jgi:hypothetical protein